MSPPRSTPAEEHELVALPTRAEARSLQRELCAWYHAEKRDLPWRRRRDAYGVWISESMLQQTRVETVIPYYERFLERFPDVEALAGAREEEVLALWSGLGYYRRARALHAAAREMVERHGGGFPEERGAALELSGIGPYTAGAVLSIAFGACEPLVDGNVARVFARLFGLAAPLGSPVLQKTLWRFAEALVPPGTSSGGGVDPGSWNQALMELGATLCTPKSPACPRCPLREGCTARAEGRVASLPAPPPRKERFEVELEMLLVRRSGRLLLVQRPPEGRMAEMWELPTRERVAAGGRPRLWSAEPVLAGLEAEGEPVAVLSHGITRHRIRARLLAGSFSGRGRSSRPGKAPAWRFVEEDQLEGLALTGLTRKALRAGSRA